MIQADTSITQVPENFDNVICIAGGAFYGCANLTSIIIPSSVTRISDGAFYNCVNLTSITLPSSVTYIGEYAFSDTGLTDVYFDYHRKIDIDIADCNDEFLNATWHYKSDHSGGTMG